MKFSVVEIKGGFGNQLFQYNFANYLKLQNHNVWINNYWFKTNQDKYDRSEIFKPDFYGFTKASKFKLKYIELNDRLFSNDNVKYTPISDENFHYKNPSIFNYYFGYWQDVAFLDNTKKFFIKTLSKDPNFNLSINNKYKDSVMIHIRSKDYGLEKLELEYYENAIKLLNKKSKTYYFNLFTDEKKIIDKLPFKKYLHSVTTQKENEDDTLSTFYEMIKHENFIISNSTFSFMSALIGSNKNNYVVQPNPWMKNKNKKLYIKNWEVINRNL